MKNLDNLLSIETIVNDQGFPVYVHPEYGMMVAWNGHHTFNLYREVQQGCWENYDAFMIGQDKTITVQQAEKIAKDHFEEEETEDE